MSDLAENLKLLCATHRSVSDLCRRIGINRQQFNKYLSGESHPSAHNLRRIALYFNLPAEDLLLPVPDFKRRHGAEYTAAAPGGDPVSTTMAKAFPGDLRRLRPLLGFYHSHFLVPQSSAVIMRSLINLVEVDGRVYSKSIERMGVGTTLTGRGRGYLSKYDGLVSHLGNCIFILEFESLTTDTIAETILYPSYRKRLDVLTGMSLGVSSRVHRQLFSTLIAWKYLGQTIDTKDALSRCGLIAKEDRSLDPAIRTFLLSKDMPSIMSLTPREP